MKDFTKHLRALASSSFYQTIYSQEKSLGIRVFQNECDLNPLQITFLQLLALYHTINMEVALGEVKEVVLKNDVYIDSYLLYKQEKEKKDRKKAPQATTNTSSPVKNSNVAKVNMGESNWVFKTPFKRVG